MRFLINIPHFNLELLALSHGWVNLAPFHWDAECKTLSRFDCVDDVPVRIDVNQANGSALIRYESIQPLPSYKKNALRRRMQYMLSADIDLSPFIEISKKKHLKMCKFVLSGGGRFLRGTTLYEDVVKTLLTTNASWEFTKLMCSRLITYCSGKASGCKDMMCFPCEADVASVPLTILNNKCKLGYRAEYLKGITEVFIEHDSFTGWEAADVLDVLSKTKGIGSYSLNHIRMIMGLYDRIPVDSEVIRYMQESSLPTEEKAIQKHYAPWHPYEFLAYKVERRIKKQNWIGD